MTRAAQTTRQISSMFCLKCVSFALFLIDEYILFFFLETVRELVRESEVNGCALVIILLLLCLVYIYVIRFEHGR